MNIVPEFFFFFNPSYSPIVFHRCEISTTSSSTTLIPIVSETISLVSNRIASIYRSMSFSPECRYPNRVRNRNFDYRFAYTGSRHMGHFLVQEKIWCTRSSPLFDGFGWRWCTFRIWRAFLIKIWSYLIYVKYIVFSRGPKRKKENGKVDVEKYRVKLVSNNETKR